MEMNSTSITSANYLANIQIQIIRSLLTPTLIIGNLNNLINIFIFSQKSLKSHICAWYFIGVSFFHLLYLNVGCLTRVIVAWTGYDLSAKSPSFCKVRIYFVLNGLIISRYLLCLISIDRWMITSRNTDIRQQSSPKIARRLIIGGVLFLITINIFVSIGYVIDKNLGCGPSTDSTYLVFYTTYNSILSLAPLFTLITFSLLILLNIRHRIQNQICPITQITLNHETTHRKNRFHKKDFQFIKLSLIQVAGYILFNILHGCNTIYGITTQNKIKSSEQRSIETFLNGIGLNLHYIYTGITFFLYTLASVTFRKVCILSWKRWTKRLLRLVFIQSE